MLVPLTRQKFEQLIPRIATGVQYRYCSGKSPDFLRRLLISVVAVVVIIVLAILLGQGFNLFSFLLGTVGALYWLWGPVFWASLRNAEYRRYKYSGFFRGRVLDVFVTEELIGKEETVSNRGDLVIVENRESRLNLEVGDETGFTTEIQVPLRREHNAIAPNQIVEMIVLSNKPDLSTIARVTDVFIPSRNLWVSDYPYLQRFMFVEVSRRIRNDADQPRRRSQRKPRPSSRKYID